MSEYRILVTGSRTWTDKGIISRAFDSVEPYLGMGGMVTLIHGGAAGADTFAARIAKQRGWAIEEHPAQWTTHTDKCPDWHWGLPKCKMAGHRRNAEMVNSGVDICLAFIKDNSSGATGCADLARRAGIDTRVWSA